MKKKAKKKAVAAKKFGVAALAKLMKIAVATVRMKLREAKVTKSGKSYGWDSEAEMSKVAKKLAA